MDHDDQERISVRQGRRIVPIVPCVVNGNSILAGRGFRFEHHSIPKSEFPERELQSHVLYLHTGPSVPTQIESAEFKGPTVIHAGNLWLMPQGSRHAVRFEDGVEGFALSFSSSQFTHMVESADSGSTIALHESVMSADARLEHLMRALACQITNPVILAAQSTATAIALLVWEQCGSGPKLQGFGKSRLSRKQLLAIEHFVMERIQNPIDLHELASVAALSVFHFSRAFKQSVGTTPHQYVLQKRIEKAKQLLRSNRLSIAETGMMVGFAHQSHFSRAFRKLVGMSPASFQRYS